MIALFQATTGKPVARAIHKFNQSTTAKWVPINKSFVTLTKIILRAAVQRINLSHAAITLQCVSHQGYRHLVLANDWRGLQAAAGQAEEFIISTQEVSSSPFEDFVAETAFSLPLDFKQPEGQAQRLGYMVVQLASGVATPGVATPGQVVDRTQLTKELSLVADEIVRTIGRYQTRYRAIHIYGDQGYWIGNSKALRQLDQHLDHLAKVTQPVLIRADKGAGKVIAARSLHCLTRADTAPFIESDCREWEEGAATNILQSLHTYANGGSLFLRNVDALSPAGFQALRNFWLRAATAQFDGSYSLRLIMSLSRRDVDLVSPHAQWLVQQACELGLPGLAERRDDIRDLAQFYIGEFALGEEFDLTEEAWRLLEAADWTGNVEQLKAVIKKLALSADGALISAAELQPLLP